MFVAASDNYVGRSIVEYGEWSQYEIDLLEKIIQPGMVVLDIGANVGYHTLAMSKAVGPTGHVISFEPQPAIFQLLAANIAINNLSNVTALNMALGEARGLVDMPSFNYDSPQNFGALRLENLLRHEQASVTHTPIALQQLDSIHLARDASVIKMDVECMEIFVLRGAMNLIGRNRPVMLIENNDPGTVSENILKLLQEIEYDCYWQLFPSYNSENYNKKEIKIFEDYINPNVFSIPTERKMKVIGLKKITDIYEHPRGTWHHNEAGA
ncbi:MAG: FkbM family methyltransferase [Rhizobiaceae bacterium]|nr:FkbM family methyltransferase [Rhizobiaceae bacterium]